MRDFPASRDTKRTVKRISSDVRGIKIVLVNEDSLKISVQLTVMSDYLNFCN